MRREIIFDDLMEKIPNKYLLTVIAGKRAREIYSGETSYLPHEAKDTVVRKVLMEILYDKIVVVDEETQVKHEKNEE